MSKTKSERILFLSRVFPDDCVDIDTMINDRILEGVSETEFDVEAIVYNTIPKNFTNLKTWKKSTNLLCWYCNNSFDTVPIFCPEFKFEKSPDKKIMKVLGNFCTFSCASKYNSIYAKEGQERWRRNKLLLELYKIFYNEEISQIPPSPDKETMIQWGGFLTREQYDDTIALSMSNYQKTIKNNSISSIEVNRI